MKDIQTVIVEAIEGGGSVKDMAFNVAHQLSRAGYVIISQSSYDQMNYRSPPYDRSKDPMAQNGGY